MKVKNRIIRDELEMEIRFRLCDIDRITMKSINSRKITKYVTSVSVNMDDGFYPKEDTIENKIALLNTKLKNLMKSFEINFEDKKLCIIERILEKLKKE